MKHLKLTQDNGTIFLNTIDNIKNNQKLIERWWRDLELWAVELLLVAHCTCYSARVWVVLQSVKMHSPLPDEADTQRMLR